MGLTKTSVRHDGFDATLFPAADRKDKVVITLSGSEGGLRHAEKMARHLQGQGMPALALGYFGTGETQEFLSRVPLEYVDAAIGWLRGRGYQRIAVEGLSKGAEYAAAAATTFSEISCAVLKTPAWFYGEGIMKGAPSDASCWTYRGQELPYTPYRERSFPSKRDILRRAEYDILSLNAKRYVRQASAVPIERIAGPVLFFSTEADTVWPSSESAKKLEDRLVREGFAYPYPYEHVCFDFMSHLMLEDANRLVRVLFRSEREHPRECAEERASMSSKMHDWLERVW